MNWIKRNLFWLVGLLCFALVVLGSLLLLKNQIVERDKVARELGTAREELNRLVTRPIYPDPKNVRQMVEDNDQLDQKFYEIRTKFAKADPPSETLTGIKFREFMNKKLQDLNMLARRQGVSLGTDYLFGFDRYKEAIPENAHVPLLMQQLGVEEEIATVLFKSPRILLLDSLKRVEFEDNDPNPKGNKPTEMPNGYMGIQNDPGRIFMMMPFEISFACDPEGLRNFLNSLASSKYVLIPAYLNIKCDETEITAKAAKPKVTPEGEVFTPLPEEALIAEETTKYVLGQQKINVTMRIDWFQFRPVGKRENGEKETGRGKRERNAGKETNQTSIVIQEPAAEKPAEGGKPAEEAKPAEPKPPPGEAGQ